MGGTSMAGNRDSCLERVAEAARELLKAGQHLGPCTNADNPEDACAHHIVAYGLRSTAMIAALAALDEFSTTHPPGTWPPNVTR